MFCLHALPLAIWESVSLFWKLSYHVILLLVPICSNMRGNLKSCDFQMEFGGVELSFLQIRQWACHTVLLFWNCAQVTFYHPDIFIILTVGKANNSTHRQNWAVGQVYPDCLQVFIDFRWRFIFEHMRCTWKQRDAMGGFCFLKFLLYHYGCLLEEGNWPFSMFLLCVEWMQHMLWWHTYVTIWSLPEVE